MPHTHRNKRHNKGSGGGGGTPPQQQSQGKNALRGMSLQQQQQSLQPQGGQKGGGQKGQQGGKTTPPPRSNESALKRAAHKLGEVASIDGAFQGIGGLLDVLAPTAGQGFSGSVDVKIKPPLGSGFYMNLNLEGTAKRNTDDKLELEGKVALVIGGAGKVSYFEGYVGARGMLAVKATGKSGYDCLRLMGLGIHQTIAAWTPKGADWLFGAEFEKNVVEGMVPKTEGNKADGLEYTGELGVEGGLGGGGEEGGPEGKLATGYRGKHTLSKEKPGDKKIASETDHGLMVVLGGKAKALGLELEGAIDMFVTKDKPVQWELKGEIAADADKLKDAMQVVKALGDLGGGLLGTARSAAALQEKGGQGDKGTWAKVRTALGGLSIFPKTAVGLAMHDKGKNAPLGTKAAFELGLKFEGKELKEFNLEALQKYEPSEGTKDLLGKAGVELGGKQSTTLVNKKLD